MVLQFLMIQLVGYLKGIGSIYHRAILIMELMLCKLILRQSTLLTVKVCIGSKIMKIKMSTFTQTLSLITHTFGSLVLTSLI